MQATRRILVSLLSLIGTRAYAQHHLFTASAKEMSANFVREGVVGYVYAASGKAGTVPVYRWFHAASGDHLLTTTPNEPAPTARTGWTPEGIASYAFSAKTSNSKPVGRFYNAATHDRLYSGLCVNPANDPNHCGACGKACATATVCVAGACIAECGGAGQPCCVTGCGAGLKCLTGTCRK